MRPVNPRWPPRGSGIQGRQRLLPHIRPRNSGASLTNTCMMGASWTSTCRPRWVWAMMKKVEGLKSVTLAVDTGDEGLSSILGMGPSQWGVLGWCPHLPRREAGCRSGSQTPPHWP